LVVDNLHSLFGGAPGIGADQTQRYAQDVYGDAGDQQYLKGSTQPGTAGGVMSWTNDGTAEWGIGAVAFKAVSSGGTAIEESEYHPTEPQTNPLIVSTWG
jgi:hypothetical protein